MNESWGRLARRVRRCPEPLLLVSRFAVVARQRASGAKRVREAGTGGRSPCEAREGAEGGQGREDWPQMPQQVTRARARRLACNACALASAADQKAMYRSGRFFMSAIKESSNARS